jgi:hypothetical protein
MMETMVKMGTMGLPEHKDRREPLEHKDPKDWPAMTERMERPAGT